MSQTSASGADLQRLVALAQHAASGPSDPTTHCLGRARLLERVERMPPRSISLAGRRSLRPKLVWAMAAVAMAVVIVWGIRSRPVSYVVRELPAAASYVSAVDNHPVDVDFTDGTRITAELGARFRIVDRSRHGARILVERGRSTVSVVHQPDSDWRFAAGPFEVLVTGTKFWIDWDPAAEEFNLSLEAGSIEVTGPLSPSHVTMHAGQRIQASLTNRSLTVFDTAARPTPSAAAANMTPHVASTLAATNLDPAAARSASSAPGEPSPPQSPSWSKLLAKGHFEAIVQLAESPSRPSCAENCSASELRVLAEAARYAGRGDLAETILLALRKRFPSHQESQKSAFLLARLYESRADRGRAENWYRTYLEESPSSELAADALAGQMRVVRRARGFKAAEPLAREYLRRYPQGVHAAAARQILLENQ